MANRRPPPRPRPTEEQGLIARVITLLIQIILVLVLSLVLSIIMEWVGMAFFWSDEGLSHSRRMLAQEIDYLNQFQRSILIEPPARFAARLSEGFYHYAFQVTGVEDFIRWMVTPVTSPSALHRHLAGAYHLVGDYILAAMTIAKVFAVRLAVLLLSLPAYLLLGLTAFIDGLMQRDLRRWSGGRESSFVYHAALGWVAPTFFAPWVIYLSIPTSVHPNFVVLPFALLFAFALAIVAASFKKYL